MGCDTGMTTLYEAWVKADSSQQNGIVTEVTRALVNIPETEAQALSKDPDIPSLHYRLYGVWQSCTCCNINKGYKSTTLLHQSNSV